MTKKNDYKIIVKSNKLLKHELSNGDVDENNAFIICTSYDDLNFDLKKKIILRFDDTMNLGYSSFSKEHAKIIHKFVDEISDIDYLYICCDYGVSRSSAVAAALLRYKNMNENQIWKNPNYSPNLLVYKILCGELKLKNNKIRLKYKSYLNKSVIRKTIANSRSNK